ncbi:MAG: hypothetical protein CL666_14480 [Balneola sp.]|nr:hypothetical protein [Balneola sp.]|tara:strand:- start:42227 stop:43147 length:921 start_codon:yes stop_codon:yes gene_type:complete
MNKNFLLLIPILLSSLLVSCELYPQDDYEEYYVVESYMMANNPLPNVRLSTTAPANELYEFEEFAVNNANVEVRLLETGANSSVVEQFTYSNLAPGIYWADQNHRIKPTRTYQLHISFDDSDQVITAHTTIPDTFRIMPGTPETVTYQSEEQLELTLTKSFYPGRQNIYVFNVITQEPSAESLTPLYADLFSDSEQPEEDLILLSNNSSGIINEANFQDNQDGTITLSYPWIGIAFYGVNNIVANAIDDNVYDFVRSQQVQLGGSTLSPGEIQNVIYHVEGGLGVFGSLATDTVTTFVSQPSFNKQ